MMEQIPLVVGRPTSAPSLVLLTSTVIPCPEEKIGQTTCTCQYCQDV